MLQAKADGFPWVCLTCGRGLNAEEARCLCRQVSGVVMERDEATGMLRFDEHTLVDPEGLEMPKTGVRSPPAYARELRTYLLEFRAEVLGRIPGHLMADLDRIISMVEADGG
jgi:hypothetical protein